MQERFSLKITGIEQTILKLRNAAKRHELTVTQAYKNFVWTVFRDVVEHTPQWSGNLATNWRIEVGTAWLGHGVYSQHPSYSEDGKGLGKAKFAGHPDAVQAAIESEADSLSRIRYNSKVRIVNYTPYAEEVENGVGPETENESVSMIRAVNLFSGPNVPAHGVAMVEYAIMKYGKYKYRNAAYTGTMFNNISGV